MFYMGELRFPKVLLLTILSGDKERRADISLCVCDGAGREEGVLEIIFMIISTFKREIKVTHNVLRFRY